MVPLLLFNFSANLLDLIGASQYVGILVTLMEKLMLGLRFVDSYQRFST